MPKITIGNSISNVSDISREVYNAVREKLSIKPNPQQFYYVKDKRFLPKKYLVDKHGNFPTGLCELVWDLLKVHYGQDSNILVKDNRYVPHSIPDFPILHLPFTPYEFQTEAASRALLNVRGIIQSPTGTGKSAIMALIIAQVRVRTLVVVPSLELRNQAILGLKMAFGEGYVGKVDDNTLIMVEHVQGLDPKKVIPEVGCVIIDEFHHAASKSYQQLNKYAWNDIYYRIGLTATPFRRNEDENILLQGILADIIYIHSYSKAIKGKHILPIEGCYYSLPKIPIRGRKDHWGSVYSELIVNREDRNNLICNISDALIACTSENNVLILVLTINHGELLQALFKKKFNLEVPFANGVDKNSPTIIRDFSNGDVRLIIATNIVGEGVDTRACNVVILAGGSGKSKSRLMQNAGRTCRKFNKQVAGIVISFKDPSHKWMLDHHKMFCTTFKDEYSFEAIQILK